MSTPAFDRAAMRLLAAIADAMPPAPPMYFAACGRRRGFLSVSDMQAYERGYYGCRDGAQMPRGVGPELDGWMDRSAEGMALLAPEPAIVSVRDLDTGMQSWRLT
jgi:hypothetical protein